ncbi:TetR/AcrR family transcriptional regulator [Subtercola sp. Z020]|uniref:TetR/AcrR family transcriptional regulator n=1 Tax=Subtercola sp. Z020 TaxID=2080582 RepID=UPI000CE73E27|nr:TetR/AcrR family transcriptional regulator [Subtercola sp. Z020]PPF87152.1 TetR/AcrR family transcriptional regulator [Subtercola sp. Z020]
MDARQRRSRDNLRRAILSLAADTAASGILASEVAAAAGVNRSTFYDHAASPTALLEDVLREELDALREEFLSGASAGDAAAAIAGVTRSVLEHAEQHRAIYLLGLDENSGPASLHPMLSSHFEASIRLLLAQHTITFDSVGVGALPDALVAEMATRMVADGSVGAILAWLRSPAPRSVDAFLSAYAQLLPAWFPFAA